jgi:hypothetical protein
MRLVATLCLFGFAWAYYVDGSSSHQLHQSEPPPCVNLDYATYEGTTRSPGINEFLGMRFDRPKHT